MIFTQQHQIFDRVAAGADIDSIVDMIVDYLRGEKYRQMCQEAEDRTISTDQIPEITKEDVAAWLSEHYAELRRVSYPHWTKQLEMIYEDEAGWRNKISQIKKKFPKKVPAEAISLFIIEG